MRKLIPSCVKWILSCLNEFRVACEWIWFVKYWTSRAIVTTTYFKTKLINRLAGVLHTSLEFLSSKWISVFSRVKYNSFQDSLGSRTPGLFSRLVKNMTIALKSRFLSVPLSLRFWVTGSFNVAFPNEAPYSGPFCEDSGALESRVV